MQVVKCIRTNPLFSFSFLSKLKLEQGDLVGKSARIAVLCTKYFNRFASSPPFNDCSNRDTETLAKELRDALATLYTQNAEKTADKEIPATPTEDVEHQDHEDTHRNVDTLAQEVEEGEMEAESRAMSRRTTNETPVSTNQLQKGKKRLMFSGEVPGPSKKHKNSDLQHSCDDCLVSGKCKKSLCLQCFLLKMSSVE